ncbi:oxidoreductase-like protein [Ampelomyces quisqualis]|uniref:Oxidoreductase-like protein n=1 Tax=Ampelomyces quisqualis TaxID=50730 RepID=A0A6A5R118_AMPQU|nr:oxidoreductase-like protein [Ampelomyces quisqualis]
MRQTHCTSCFRALRRTSSSSASERLGLHNSHPSQRRYKGYIAPAGGQARPITGFYAEILKKPLSKVQPLTENPPERPQPEPLAKTQKELTLEKARIVFGSKLAGPAERRKEMEAASKVIAGVTVPPKPTEPDNCCMSGCVNCVWDMFRDDMEEWATKSAQARRAMQAQREEGVGSGHIAAGGHVSSHAATSMDDDGGGSESNWSVEDGEDSSSLFDDIPVGIREFMRTEKKLKMQQRVAKEATA